MVRGFETFKLNSSVRGELGFYVTLRKSHYEDQVNGDETEQIAHDHSINHYDERTDRFETPTEE